MFIKRLVFLFIFMVGFVTNVYVNCVSPPLARICNPSVGYVTLGLQIRASVMGVGTSIRGVGASIMGVGASIIGVGASIIGVGASIIGVVIASRVCLRTLRSKYIQILH
jgi:hypothetical protein